MDIYKNKTRLPQVDSYHHCNTRKTNISYPRHKLTVIEKHRNYAGIRFYNKIPDKIKNCRSKNTYKRKVKELLINMEPFIVYYQDF